MDSRQTERFEAIKEAIRAGKTTLNIVEQVGITIEEKPSIVTPRPGYKWSPHQAKAGGAIMWVEEADPNAEGTADKPIMFKVGMEVYENYYYTDGVKRYVCIKAGMPPELADGEYFTQF